MSKYIKNRRHIVNIEGLPDKYPTHLHSAEFWEALGRAVATYGFLEQVLGKAIFSFSATREYAEDEIDEVYTKWDQQLLKAISDPLGSLINKYEKVVQDHTEQTVGDFDTLINKLRAAKEMRDVLCHGSWSAPDKNGRSVPFYVTRKSKIFVSPIDVEFLIQVRTHVSELACDIVSSVTYMGWQFPSTGGPGKPIM